MAHKDPNVFNRINTLNSNLENGNIAEVQKDISTRLFGVLEWANSISVDSELYASINNVADASNITNYINTAKNSLPHENADRVTIGYDSWHYHVNNTRFDLTTLTWIDETQNAINDMNRAIAGLNALPGQINALRTRLQENHTKLNEIRNIQSAWIPGTLTNIDTHRATLRNYKTKCRNLIAILRTIDRLENLSYYDDWTTRWTNAKRDRDNAVRNFNTVYWRTPSFTWNLPDWTPCNVSRFDLNADSWAWKLTECEDLDGRIETLDNTYEQERWNRVNLDRLIGQLPKQLGDRITVPNDLWLFNSDGTIVTSALATLGDTDTERSDITNRLNQLDVLQWQIETLRARYQDNLNKLNRILALQQLEQRMDATHPGEIDRRQREFNTIREISHNNLLLWPWAPGTYEPYLPNTAIGVWERWVWWNPARQVHLDFINWALWHWFNGWARNFRYSLCDEAWNPLRNNWWRLEIQQWWQSINIRWITFDDATQRMNIDNLEITPINWLTFPLNLDLNVRVRIHDNDTGLDIDHHKPIHIEITRPTLVRADREAAYNSLVPPMNDRITAEYTDRYREELENEAIWKILREWWNDAEVNEIYNNETRRNMLINRIRERLMGHFPFLAIGNLQTWFRTDMTREDRDVPVQYLLNQNAFQNYVRQNFPSNLRNFASWQINTNANVYRDDIFQEFLDFQTEISNNPKDNLDNLRALAQVPDDANWPQSHPDSRWQRIRWERSRRNNYTKFFKWRSANLDNQTLDTEDWEIKYWVNIECTWVNKIVATINIDWKEEPEIIEAANHDRLITWILNRANTKDGEPLNRKLRCNIALSVLKAMVMMAPQKLNREIAPTNFTDARWNNIICDRIEAGIVWWNLRIRWVNVNGARVRTNVPIFDENQFKSLHDIDMLEHWIHELSTQINSIMNATAEEYQWAVDNIEDNRWLLRYNTVQRLRWWPIKRLWWRIRYGKTNNNFDFDTSVSEAWKNVNIAFNWWKFTVSWEFDGQEYKYETRNLWSILRKKINRKRVFDWIELAMMASINEQYIEMLRTNNLIQTENFAVSDLNNDKTGKIYIFDESGNLSYLEIEDRALNPLWWENAGRIDPDDIPMQRIRCNDQERREFMQNPLLAWRLLREMRRRLALR